MKLRNKKTGQVGSFMLILDHFECSDLDYVPFYYSLSELLNEWEDVNNINDLNIEPTKKPNYRCNYISCYCPKCRENITLKIYARTPILRVDIDEPKEK